MKSLILIATLAVAATAHSQTTPKSGCAGGATECGGKQTPAPATNIYSSTKAPSNIYSNTAPPAQPRNVEATISPRSTPAPATKPAAAPAPKPAAAAPRAASASTNKPKN